MKENSNESAKPELTFSEEERANYEAERANEAWFEFVLNGQPKALAKYLKCGGEVDGDVRKALIYLLKDDPRGNPGGSKPFRDYHTFVEVNSILLKSKIHRVLGDHDGATQPRAMSKRQALIQHSERTRQELARVEAQYKRGKKISEEF